MIDLSKLTPAPWEVHDGGRPDHSICAVQGDGCRPLFERTLFERWDCKTDTTDAEFACVARNAFDVMQRLNVDIVVAVCTMFSSKEMSHAQRKDFAAFVAGQNFTDLFTALVEADKWYRQNVQNPGGPSPRPTWGGTP